MKINYQIYFFLIFLLSNPCDVEMIEFLYFFYSIGTIYKIYLNFTDFTTYVDSTFYDYFIFGFSSDVNFSLWEWKNFRVLVSLFGVVISQGDISFEKLIIFVLYLTACLDFRKREKLRAYFSFLKRAFFYF